MSLLPMRVLAVCLLVLHIGMADGAQETKLHSFVSVDDVAMTKPPHSGKKVDYAKFGLKNPATEHGLLENSLSITPPVVKTFRQLVDHANPDGATFDQRYWVNDAHYKNGGPVILLVGGEFAGTNRLLTLQEGIGDILAKAVGGKAVLLENRYYGDSVPTADLSTKNLRYLTVDQTVRDLSYFRQSIPKTLDVTKDTPWVVWGASYGGLLAALARKRYPDDFVGAIASSAMISRNADFPEYWDSIMSLMPGLCRDAVVNAVAYIEDVCEKQVNGQSNPRCKKLKESFLMDSIEDIDFLQSLSLPLNFWQLQRWDKPSDVFRSFCQWITSGVTRPAGSPVSAHAITVLESAAVEKVVANWADYSTTYLTLEYCEGTIASCFASYKNYNGADPARDDFSLDATFRPNLYQQCTEIGLMRTAESSGEYASLISRRLDHQYYYGWCTAVFHDLPSAIPSTPNVDAVNKYGGADLSATNIAYIDGAQDAWLQATAHGSSRDSSGSGSSGSVHRRATSSNGTLHTDAKPSNTSSSAAASADESAGWTYKGPTTWRTFDVPTGSQSVGRHTDSPSSPFRIMAGAVHHWDEYGVPGESIDTGDAGSSTGSKTGGGGGGGGIGGGGSDDPPPSKSDLTAAEQRRTPAEVVRVQQALIAAVRLWTKTGVHNGTTSTSTATDNADGGGGGGGGGGNATHTGAGSGGHGKGGRGNGTHPH